MEQLKEIVARIELQDRGDRRMAESPPRLFAQLVQVGAANRIAYERFEDADSRIREGESGKRFYVRRAQSRPCVWQIEAAIGRKPRQSSAGEVQNGCMSTGACIAHKLRRPAGSAQRLLPVSKGSLLAKTSKPGLDDQRRFTAEYYVSNWPPQSDFHVRPLKRHIQSVPSPLSDLRSRGRSVAAGLHSNIQRRRTMLFALRNVAFPGLSGEINARALHSPGAFR
jgi:hypothetical protein